MFVHEDERRTLYEIDGGPFAVCKALITKEHCKVGDHYHKNKDESFLLLSGWADHIVVGDRRWDGVTAPFSWTVPRGTYHVFCLRKGSVLIGTATKPFDPEDEIPGKPQ